MLKVAETPKDVKIEVTPHGPYVLWPRDGSVWVYAHPLPTWMPDDLRAAFERVKAEFEAKGKPDAIR